MTLRLTTHTCLTRPDVEDGFVVWSDVALVRMEDDDHVEPMGSTHAAVIHAGAASAVSSRIHDVLEAESAELYSLYGLYLDDEGLKREFATGVGPNLLYIRTVELLPEFAGRNIEYAIVRRLCDVLGGGCAIAVIRCGDASDSERWKALGFQVSRPGVMHAWLGNDPPELVEVDGQGLVLRSLEDD